MPITVLYFAAAREAAGLDRETLDRPSPPTVAALRRRLHDERPALRPILARCRFAVERDFAAEDDEIPEGAEVALVPPVAGGAGPLYRVRAAPLSLDEATASVAGPDAGGLVTFTGSVRARSRGRDVVRLDYEAFVPMAERQLAAIGAACAARWPGARVAILHRIGTLEVGEAAVVIAAAAPHREEAFAACRHAIERLKEEAAIWKKEHFTDGTEWVGLGP